MELALYKGDVLLGLFDSYQEVADLSNPANFKRTDKGGRLKLYNYTTHDYHFYEQLEELT